MNLMIRSSIISGFSPVDKMLACEIIGSIFCYADG
jgi:hypothetical protein